MMTRSISRVDAGRVVGVIALDKLGGGKHRSLGGALHSRATRASFEPK